MQWKQLWTLPSQGGMWLFQNAGKWLEEAGRLEMSQWMPPYDAFIINDVVDDIDKAQLSEQQMME